LSLLGVCRFVSLWVSAIPNDFSLHEIHSLLPSILSEMETNSLSANIEGNEKLENAYFEECRTKLTKLLNCPPKEPNMKMIPFYREWKEDQSGMIDISKKVMDVNNVSTVASHLLEWCIQVFDNV